MSNVRPGYTSQLSIPDPVILENDPQLPAAPLTELKTISQSDFGVTFGREYLAAWHRLIMPIQDGTNPLVIVSGDSTTDGSSIVDSRNLLANGLKTSFTQMLRRVDVVNRGHSGADTSQWLNTFLAPDIASAPHLYILRWGLNDGSQSVRPDFEANLRAGLTILRAALPLSRTSVILMTPNSTNDVPNGRDQTWHQTMNPIIRRAARDFHCAFIDTYSMFRDSNGAHVDWMDDPYGDGRHIHPLDVENRWIINEILKLAVPEGFKDFGSSQLVNVDDYQERPLAASLPNSAFYRRGITIHRVLAANGWPFEGQATTVLQSDGVWFQTNTPYLSDNGFAVRRGFNGTWGPWQYMGTTLGVVTAATGWELPATEENMAVIKSGELISINGYLAQTVAAAIAVNTIVGYVQAGFRPTGSPVYGVSMAAYYGGNWQYIRGQIELDGTIRTKESVTLVADRIYVIGTWPSRTA